MPQLIQLGNPFIGGQSPYEMFQDRMQMVNVIAQNYKRYQEKKWDAEWQQAALMDLDKAKNQKTDILLSNINPPDNFLDMEGATKFADQAIGMLRQKEIMMGNLPKSDNAGTIQQGASPQAGTATMPDLQEFDEILKFVSELPTGQINWDNTLNTFQQRLEKKRALGDAATQFLNTIMGQGVPNQREKFEADYVLAKDIKETLYPDKKQEALQMPQTEMQLFLTNPQVYAEFKKAQKAEPEKPQIDLDQFNSWLKDSGMVLKGGSVNPSTGNLSYTFGTPETKEGKAPIEQTIAKAEEYVKNHPGTQISSINFETGSVSIGQKPKETPDKPSSDYERWLADPDKYKEFKELGKDTETDKTTPTYSIIQSINKDLMDSTKDYDRVLQQAGVKYDLSDPAINLVSKEERARYYYDFALKGDQETYGLLDEDIVDSEGFVKDEAEYSGLYAEYEKAAKEYYEATGVLLPKDFLSPEEAGKYTGLTMGKGYKGGLKPVKNPGNVPWSFAGSIDRTEQFVKEAKANGKNIDDYDVNQLKSMGVDIEKARRLLGE